MNPQPDNIGWTYAGTDNGFVSPSAYQDPDIICHKSATPADAHALVAAGDKISIQWTPWPDSHHGPVLDYLANCNGPCESVDKTSLEFFKIDGPGWISGADPGIWASDTLISDNNTWLVQIPADIAPGYYVLRHEIIALHAAGSLDGAQNYPQCFNLQITGSGSSQPSGIPGTALYQATDPGILYNLYTSPEVYTVPGPTLIPGVPSSIAQSSSTATATSTPLLPGQTGAGSGSGSTTKTAAPANSSTVPSTASAAPTTSSPIPASTTTAAAGNGGSQTKYGQCGGIGWSGPTSCASGSSCTTLNNYYAQCL